MATPATTTRVASEKPSATILGSAARPPLGSTLTTTAPTVGSSSAVVNQGKLTATPSSSLPVVRACRVRSRAGPSCDVHREQRQHHKDRTAEHRQRVGADEAGLDPAERARHP